MLILPAKFQQLILKWFDQHGRKHLPWQQNKTPYRVWISEIMLQQTQVSTVIPYYQRFMQQFPDIISLANALDDEVLHLWAGLGYYSRARNLHRAAKMVATEFNGIFPETLADLLKLPGIGQSTAGAILAIAFNKPAAILDGNVRRVLTRFFGITDPVNDKKVEAQLWDYAQRLAPTKRIADYTQAMMDLGATLCIRGKPQCSICPLQHACVGLQQGIAAELPKKKSGRKIPVRVATFFVFKKENQVLLRKRPPTGIWGGLWSLPEMTGLPDEKNIQTFCKQHFNIAAKQYQCLPAFRHTFSHYHLDIHPIMIVVKKAPAKVMEAGQQIWYKHDQPETIGLPKPIQQIIKGLA